MVRATLIAATALWASAAIAVAPGAGDGGCCGIAPEKINSALRLIEQVSDVPRRDLELRIELGEICGEFDCGVLTEDEARRSIQASLAQNATWWDRV